MERVTPRRVRRLEAATRTAWEYRVAVRVAAELGRPLADVLAEARAIGARHRAIEAQYPARPGLRLADQPAFCHLAAELGLDPREWVAEAERLVAQSG